MAATAVAMPIRPNTLPIAHSAPAAKSIPAVEILKRRVGQTVAHLTLQSSTQTECGTPAQHSVPARCGHHPNKMTLGPDPQLVAPIGLEPAEHRRRCRAVAAVAGGEAMLQGQPLEVALQGSFRGRHPDWARRIRATWAAVRAGLFRFNAVANPSTSAGSGG